MISLNLTPRGVDMHDAYVTGVLRLQVPLGYPDVSPHVELLDTKGISDDRLALLRKQLCGVASMLAGEMALGAICEHALDWITEHNRPEGLCAFCLNAMEPPRSNLSLVPNPDGHQDTTEQPLVRLPCYHAFHRSCYRTWWCWRQKSLEAQERELVNHTGASAASVLREQGLPPCDGHGVYETSCPVCRAPAPLDSLGYQLQDELLTAAAEPVALTCIGRNDITPSGCTGQHGAQVLDHQQQSLELAPALPGEPRRHRLSAQDLEAYREVQLRHARVLERQRAAGGLIETACYSITGWTLGSEPALQDQGKQEQLPSQMQPESKVLPAPSRRQQHHRPQPRPRSHHRLGGEDRRKELMQRGDGSSDSTASQVPCVAMGERSQSRWGGPSHNDQSGTCQQQRAAGVAQQQQRQQPQSGGQLREPLGCAATQAAGDAAPETLAFAMPRHPTEQNSAGTAAKVVASVLAGIGGAHSGVGAAISSVGAQRRGVKVRGRMTKGRADGTGADALTSQPSVPGDSAPKDCAVPAPSCGACCSQLGGSTQRDGQAPQQRPVKAVEGCHNNVGGSSVGSSCGLETDSGSTAGNHRDKGRFGAPDPGVKVHRAQRSRGGQRRTDL
ncbi:hypothetical protein VaNZ11_004339 [Volvox africanus]|uniref:RWD domain-containing protein n=1 Tax=Volvox africanus TaxID=51714 RepID=A0ABQ5RW27_9CHLO|nr:hypothetical protein VaNZ11_004339 [Volvox africanus]